MKFIIALISLSVVLLAFQNCAPQHTGNVLSSVDEQAQVSTEAKSIILNKCISCHGPSDTVALSTDLETLAASGLVVLGEPQNSSLYLNVVDRVEPPSSSGIALTDSEIEVLRKWIRGPSELNYIEHIRPILQVSCNSCHASGGRSLATYDDLMRNSRVVPGDLAASDLWQRLISTDNDYRMPRGMAPLRDEDLQIISDWIQSGAKEYE